jgi:hypothetical protein
MYSHPLEAGIVRLLQPTHSRDARAHRVLPALPARDDGAHLGPTVFLAHGRGRGYVVRVDHEDDGPDIVTKLERRDGARQDGHPGDGAHLLVHAAHALALSGGDYNGCEFVHRIASTE